MTLDTSLSMQSAIDAKRQSSVDRSRHLARSNQLRENDKLTPQNPENDKLKKACRDFEAIFIKQMFSAMDKTVDRQGLLGGGGMAEEYFRDMLFDSYSEQAADTVKLGIAEMMYRQMQNHPGV